MNAKKSSITVRRRIAAPPDVVYSYLTESARWARWQGATAEVDAVPGGTFRMVMPSGEIAEGTFIELVRDQRVRFTWGWRGNPSLPPGASTVSIELLADADGTIVILTHDGLSPDDRAIHEAGWQHYLPRLADVAEGRDPGRDPGP